MIEREYYLQKLISKKENGMVKVITGIRRCGKSFLLKEIYRNYLLDSGVEEKNIIILELDDDINIKYRNPIELGQYIRELVSNNDKMHYVFLDEIQKVEKIKNPYIENGEDYITFVDTILGLMKVKNIDLYVTGSNSKMLSSDILTEFRGRGDEIKVYPLTYKEFYFAYSEDKRKCLSEYFTYGGMPMVAIKKFHQEKSVYLHDLFKKTYISDVVERNHIQNDTEVLEELLNIVSSSVGSLTNPTKLANTFKSMKNLPINHTTISMYLDYFIDAFILDKAYRFDIKGKKYIDTPLKYYFTDIGLRNARLNFRQQEESHIMENVIFNELKARGLDVDVGIVEYNTRNKDGKTERRQLEVDFVVNNISNRYYIQSALNIADAEKREQEINSLKRIADSFKKIVVIKDNIIPYYDENGIYYIGIEDFLLNDGLITEWTNNINEKFKLLLLKCAMNFISCDFCLIIIFNIK